MSGTEDVVILRESGFYAKYSPKETLGYGFTSVVRKCINQLNQQEFAVKIIEKTILKQIEVHAEIAALTQLSGDPNIISLIDVFVNETHFFLVFELAEGGELYDYLNKMIMLPELRASSLMFEIIHVVQHMHQLRFVHRDLKLQNILMSKNGHILVSDFGFAVHLELNEKLKDLCGTPDYLAPEVLKCSIDDTHPGYGLQVDMWACGVIGYLLLVGFSPFWHRKQNVMIWNIMDGKYTLSGPEWDRVSEEAKSFISGLLVVDPDKRMNADAALLHPWFDSIRATTAAPRVKRRFKFVTIVRTIVSLRRLYRISIQRLSILSTDVTVQNPYSNQKLRKIIDSCAFTIYGHWIKRSSNEHQNRAAIYENRPKSDIIDEECCILTKPYQYRLSFTHQIK